MKYEITTFGRFGDIRCTREDGRILEIIYGLYGPKDELGYPTPITYDTIKHWEPPYEDEEITIEEKKEILELIDKKFNVKSHSKNKVNIEYKINIVRYDEIILSLVINYNVRNDLKYENGKFIDYFYSITEMSDCYRLNFCGDIPYIFYKYCELQKDELIKFKGEINKNKEIQYVLTEFANWKVNEDREKINQKKLNYGLYALEMVLCESTKEEVKEILKKYIELAKKKDLSFEPFMKRNRELNKMIEELK